MKRWLTGVLSLIALILAVVVQVPPLGAQPAPSVQKAFVADGVTVVQAAVFTEQAHALSLNTASALASLNAHAYLTSPDSTPGLDPTPRRLTATDSLRGTLHTYRAWRPGGDTWRHQR